MIESFSELVPLHVLPFFSVSFPIQKKKSSLFHTKQYVVPHFKKYLEEESFAELYASWDEKGIYILAKIHSDPVVEKEFRKGDSVEFFFNTRRSDERTFFTQYCHHFVFFPEKVDGAFFREVTRFRTDEVHSLRGEEDLLFQTKSSPKGYFIDIHFPQAALHGFAEKKNDLSLSSLEYDPQKVPHFWAPIDFVD
mgnify:CR=1 FL=1